MNKLVPSTLLLSSALEALSVQLRLLRAAAALRLNQLRCPWCSLVIQQSSIKYYTKLETHMGTFKLKRDQQNPTRLPEMIAKYTNVKLHISFVQSHLPAFLKINKLQQYPNSPKSSSANFIAIENKQTI